MSSFRLQQICRNNNRLRGKNKLKKLGENQNTRQRHLNEGLKCFREETVKKLADMINWISNM